ncbi:hypothetical protein ACLI1A_13205 [Flavobacterium sp. RHBU_3]|uniref:hypothetical protein n=1 Tax=Flavobacterium sp. RHBU_3 TaxID=3391184 RepID=UPI003985092E
MKHENKRLIHEKGYTFYNPRFSSNGEKITFIGRNNKTSESSIWVTNDNGKSKHKLYEVEGIIAEAVSSLDNRSIYFTKALDYKAYSPLAPKAAHNFDIYQLSLETNEVTKITELEAYSLYTITDADKERLLFSIKNHTSGIFFYNKKLKELEQITAVNDTLNNSTSYTDPVLLNEKSIVCSSYYRLVKIDLINKKEQTILASNGHQFSEVHYCKGLHRIYFRRDNDITKVCSVNENGKDFAEYLVIEDTP